MNIINKEVSTREIYTFSNPDGGHTNVCKQDISAKLIDLDKRKTNLLDYLQPLVALETEIATLENTLKTDNLLTEEDKINIRKTIWMWFAKMSEKAKITKSIEIIDKEIGELSLQLSFINDYDNDNQ